MINEHERVHKKHMHVVSRQKVDMCEVELKGRILDIGGGGEGIIGQLKKRRVVAIDSSERELREAKSGGLKIIMDARVLQFLDCTFDTVTAFFSLMYIPEDDREQIFKEVYRVLKKRGQFVIWDTIMPKRRKNSNKEMFVVPLTIALPGKKIQTVYGAPWHSRGQNCRIFKELGKKIGFSVIKTSERKSLCYVRLVKNEK